MKYSIFNGSRQITAPVPECAIRSYLTSYAGNLEALTIFGSDDPDRIDGISAIEWLQDNPDVPARSKRTPIPPAAPDSLPIMERIAWTQGWVAGAVGADGSKSPAPASVFREWLQVQHLARDEYPHDQELLESVLKKFNELF